MRIDVYFTHLFQEPEDQFADSMAIMIDVFRASTTVCAALFNGAKEVVPTDTLDSAVRIYQNLSKESRFLGGERNGTKPSGFEAGNSPLEYSPENVANRTVIFSTTNGTQVFHKAKYAKVKLIASFVNLSKVVNYTYDLAFEKKEIESINILCAGTKGRFSFEDTLCAGAIIANLISKKSEDIELTDSARAAYKLFIQEKDNIKEFLRTTDHAKSLIKLGFESDLDIASSIDAYPTLPVLLGNNIKAI